MKLIELKMIASIYMYFKGMPALGRVLASMWISTWSTSWAGLNLYPCKRMAFGVEYSAVEYFSKKYRLIRKFQNNTVPYYKLYDTTSLPNQQTQH